MSMNPSISPGRSYLLREHPTLLSGKHEWEVTLAEIDAPPSALLPLGEQAAPYAQPSSFIAQPAFQILVMWRILSPSNSMQ